MNDSFGTSAQSSVISGFFYVPNTHATITSRLGCIPTHSIFSWPVISQNPSGWPNSTWSTTNSKLWWNDLISSPTTHVSKMSISPGITLWTAARLGCRCRTGGRTRWTMRFRCRPRCTTTASGLRCRSLSSPSCLGCRSGNWRARLRNMHHASLWMGGLAGGRGRMARSWTISAPASLRGSCSWRSPFLIPWTRSNTIRIATLSGCATSLNLSSASKTPTAISLNCAPSCLLSSGQNRTACCPRMIRPRTRFPTIRRWWWPWCGVANNSHPSNSPRGSGDSHAIACPCLSLLAVVIPRRCYQDYRRTTNFYAIPS